MSAHRISKWAATSLVGACAFGLSAVVITDTTGYVTFTATDAGGTSSMIVGGVKHWSDGQDPHAGANYLVQGNNNANWFTASTFVLRTIENAAAGTPARYEVLARAYQNDREHRAIEITAGTTVGTVFTTTDAFRAFQVCCPSYANNIGALTVSLYRWAGSPAASRATPPLARRRFVDFADNETLILTFDTMKPGRYYVELSDPAERVGVWVTPRPSTKSVAAFLNGKPLSGSLQFAVLLTHVNSPRARLLGVPPHVPTVSRAPAETTGVSDDSGALIPNRSFAHRDLFADTWDAIDGLGRILATSETYGPPRDRQVGIFYWTWHVPGHGATTTNDAPYDNEKILLKHPTLNDHPTSPLWGPNNRAHYWGEPLFGYYLMTDAWVSRRHAQLLAAAGIDAVVFDATNGHLTWMPAAWTLMHTWSAMRRDGFKTPKFAYMLPFGGQSVQLVSLLQLYRDIYKPGKFRDLWYYWDGHPLIHASPEVIEGAIEDTTRSAADRKDLAEILDFFTFRPLQAAYAKGPTQPDQWCWLEAYPQHGYGRRADGTYEMCAAGVAQNHSWKARDGHQGLAAMNDINIFGRAYQGPSEKELRPGERLRFAPDRNPRRHEPNRFVWCDNFAQQLDHAIKIDPSYLFITGWNEWIAGKHPWWMGKQCAFPDQYAPPFSRDIEPSAGVMKDYAYYQLVDGVRRFRGCRPQRAANENPVYRDALHDTLPRNAQGHGSAYYTDNTGRNDITDCTVSHTAETITFRVTCAAPITSFTDPCWMRLYISTSFGDDAPHWNHFQYLVNRTSPRNATTATLERCRGGWVWEKVTEVALALDGNTLALTIPRRALGCADKKIDLRFKWTDNTTGTTEGDILDFYRHGDAAPDGRFVYRYFER